MDKNPLDNEMINNIKILCNLIKDNAEDMDKVKIRQYQNYLNDIIDNFCLDGLFTKTIGK